MGTYIRDQRFHTTVATHIRHHHTSLRPAARVVREAHRLDFTFRADLRRLWLGKRRTSCTSTQQTTASYSFTKTHCKSLLRESSKKKDVRTSNIESAKAVADAVRTSLGPRGMDKMVCIASFDYPLGCMLKRALTGGVAGRRGHHHK
jgi:hypothetical protein